MKKQDSELEQVRALLIATMSRMEHIATQLNELKEIIRQQQPLHWIPPHISPLKTPNQPVDGTVYYPEVTWHTVSGAFTDPVGI